ncbi:di-trans,poly-cis-decaprenylcistransferase, partial [bacterium]|nr:di-trans,poly-cis-decaprenylcistransferase [bacterium]
MVKSRFLSSKKAEPALNPDTLPQHIAIIMDGNGRWAKKRLLPRNMGHKAGVESLRETIQACSDLGIKHLSVWAFGTENWKRPESEVDFLMKMLGEVLARETPGMHEKNVRIKIIGYKAALAPELQNQIQISETLTAHNTGLHFNIMINYGSRLEIIHAVQSIVDEAKAGRLSDVTESVISDHLYTAGIPDPEILIRTSGEVRLSNYMLWQCAYTELFFVP